MQAILRIIINGAVLIFRSNVETYDGLTVLPLACTMYVNYLVRHIKQTSSQSISFVLYYYVHSWKNDYYI